MSISFDQALNELPGPIAAFFDKLREHPEYGCAALKMQMTVSFRGEKVGGFNRQSGVWYLSKVFVRNHGGADPPERRGFRQIVKDEHHQYWGMRGAGSLEAFRASVGEMTGVIIGGSNR